MATLLVEFSAKGCIFLPFGKLFLVIFPANATLFCLKIIKSCIDFAKICCACNSLELLDEIALHRENRRIKGDVFQNSPHVTTKDFRNMGLSPSV